MGQVFKPKPTAQPSTEPNKVLLKSLNQLGQIVKLWESLAQPEPFPENFNTTSAVQKFPKNAT